MSGTTREAAFVGVLAKLQRVRSRLSGAGAASFRSVFGRIRRWQRLAYERRLLAEMDAHQLRDIGVSRVEAERESARPFWDDAGTGEREASDQRCTASSERQGSRCERRT